jgi:hypothetical protein
MGERMRDRRGELFQDSLTENRGFRRPRIEQAGHDLQTNGEEISNEHRPKEHDGTEKEQHEP